MTEVPTLRAAVELHCSHLVRVEELDLGLQFWGEQSIFGGTLKRPSVSTDHIKGLILVRSMKAI